MAGVWVLHVDLDQFFASVEVLRRPELRGRPVVVGGSGDPAQARTVVATASREARAFGVRSGMPLRLAARKCPDTVFLPTDMPAYEQASARVMAALRGFPVRLEVWGLDEAFVGGDVDDPQRLAAELKSAILDQTGLTCAVGIGRNKNQAKIAARFAKQDPTGIATVTDETWMPLMGARPAGDLWGVGPKTVRKLDELGLPTVADLAAAGPDRLQERFPPRAARWLTVIARGGGDTEIVTEPWVAKSRSKEVTFPHDLTDRADVETQLTTLARALTAEVAAAGRQVIRVGVKVRSSTFFTQTREAKLRGGPTTDPDVIAAAAREVLTKFELKRPVRLLGVRADLHVD
ncbi:DNA polymerase IV [Paractinoplanes rishiriensis]|uniref:DNA polymerase IV n=1 Tax=Paractinoplanes rishiriensis TaxID=1050105 RepID=A0A919JYS4_9ACTN|nr:DNA polymerase IV [Actinoplanes rishiriensis]GIE97711.1 DNA polymerase IV [Actinoplanes rishiriensis]